MARKWSCNTSVSVSVLYLFRQKSYDKCIVVIKNDYDMKIGHINASDYRYRHLPDTRKKSLLLHFQLTMFPLFRKRKNRFAVFESMGVPGPKPSFYRRKPKGCHCKSKCILNTANPFLNWVQIHKYNILPLVILPLIFVFMKGFESVAVWRQEKIWKNLGVSFIHRKDVKSEKADDEKVTCNKLGFYSPMKIHTVNLNIPTVLWRNV